MNSPAIGDKVQLLVDGHLCYGQVVDLEPLQITWANGNRTRPVNSYTLDSLGGDGRSWELKFA